MSRLIIIRGNSGSGKSTLARRLQHRFGFNTMLIAQDAVRREILWVKDGPNTEALPLLIHLLKYGHAHSEVVILEGILDAEVYRPLFETALRCFGQANIHAWYYDLPFEETVARHYTRPQSAEFGEELMRRWWKEKDFIGFIPETVLTQQITLEEAEEQIYRALTA